MWVAAAAHGFRTSSPAMCWEGKGPQRRPQKPLDGRLEEVNEAVGGRLLSVTNAIEAGTWLSGGQWLGIGWAPWRGGGGGGYLTTTNASMGMHKDVQGEHRGTRARDPPPHTTMCQVCCVCQPERPCREMIPRPHLRGTLLKGRGTAPSWEASSSPKRHVGGGGGGERLSEH